MSNKRIPISWEKVANNAVATPSVLAPPSKTNYAGISAQVHIEAGPSIADTSKCVRFGFGTTTLTANNGMALGTGDVIELENLDQINEFKFITSEDGNASYIQVQYFNTND